MAGLWGLNRHGHFIGGNRAEESFVEKYLSWTQLFESVPNVQGIVLLELQKVLQQVRSEWASMDSESVGDRQRTRRLLFLFQCDLLPGISGQILSSKGARESASAGAVTVDQKLAAYTVILAVNAAMLFYIFLFALQQTKYRQNAWLQSFLLWLMTEIVFSSTIVVLVMQFVVPSLIMKDISKLKHKIADILRDFRASSGFSEEQPEDAVFNAADFLFVSAQLARQLPHLPVSKMILHFRTPWPRQSYQHVQDVSQSYSRGASYALSSFSGLLLFLLGSFVGCPDSVQDALIHMAAAAAVGYTVLLHMQLFDIFPALAFLPLFCCLVAAHFAVKSCRKEIAVPHSQVMMADTTGSLSSEAACSQSGRGGEEAMNRRASITMGLQLLRSVSPSTGRTDSDFSIVLSSPDEFDDGENNADNLLLQTSIAC